MGDAGFNLFEQLGMEVPAEVSAKPAKKDVKKKEVITKTTGKSLQVITVGKGFDIVTGYYPPEHFTADDFQKETVTFTDAASAFDTRHPEFVAKHFTLHKLSDTAYFLTVSSYEPRMNKGSVVLEEDYEISLAGFKAVIEKGSGYEEVSRLWSNQYPEFEKGEYYKFPDGKIIFPSIQVTAEPTVVTLPATVKLFGRENIVVPLPLAPLSIQKDVDEDEGEADEEDNTSDEENTDEDLSSEEGTDSEKKVATSVASAQPNPVTLADFKKLLEKEFGELKENYKISEVNGELYMVPCYIVPGSTTAAAKTVTYPTDATVSLVFTKYLLNAEMFKGKEQVTKAEFLAWLSKDYPEFSEDRTVIEYDKANNVIIPILKSSSKGMDTIEDIDKAGELLAKDYVLFRFISGNRSFRVEKTRVGLFSAPEDGAFGGKFSFYLPKIPMEILSEIYSFFRAVIKMGMRAGKPPLEAAVQLFYGKSGYFVYYPMQIVADDKVDLVRNYVLERSSDTILVADIHSHNTMPAFFSSHDNRDEKETRLFGVMGRIMSGDLQFKMRAGTGGRYIELKPEELFENYYLNKVLELPVSKEYLCQVAY